MFVVHVSICFVLLQARASMEKLNQMNDNGKIRSKNIFAVVLHIYYITLHIHIYTWYKNEVKISNEYYTLTYEHMSSDETKNKINNNKTHHCHGVSV